MLLLPKSLLLQGAWTGLPLPDVLSVAPTAALPKPLGQGQQQWGLRTSQSQLSQSSTATEINKKGVTLLGCSQIMSLLSNVFLVELLT